MIKIKKSFLNFITIELLVLNSKNIKLCNQKQNRIIHIR